MQNFDDEMAGLVEGEVLGLGRESPSLRATKVRVSVLVEGVERVAAKPHACSSTAWPSIEPVCWHSCM